MAGHFQEALGIIQTFIDRYPDHYLLAPSYMSQGRLLELSGNAPAAAALYQRFILLFPQTPWTELARSRSQVLSKNSPMQK